MEKHVPKTLNKKKDIFILISSYFFLFSIIASWLSSVWSGSISFAHAFVCMCLMTGGPITFLFLIDSLYTPLFLYPACLVLFIISICLNIYFYKNRFLFFLWPVLWCILGGFGVFLILVKYVCGG